MSSGEAGLSSLSSSTRLLPIPPLPPFLSFGTCKHGGMRKKKVGTGHFCLETNRM